jgi:3-carboxy-cis,cis-muconate cycloisomerase
MPHKRNPVRATVAIAAAVRTPGLVATVLSAMLQEHERALGGWQAEWDTIPDLVVAASQAAEAIADVLQALVVDPARMRANVNMTGGLVLAESIAMRLAPEMGKREAHAAIKRAVRRAVDGESFADALANDPAVSAILDRSEIDKALSPDDYLGSAEAFVAAVLGRRPNRKTSST